MKTGARVRFTVLRGTVGALADDEPVALGGPQQRRLLAALLANHDTVLSADRLVEAVWSHDDAPDGARRTVMSYVSRLRSTIGDEHLVTRDQGYELVLHGASLDAADFELALAEARAAEPEDAVAAYDRALALWSGRAYGEDADEWWLQPVAGRLEELRLLALGERAEAMVDGGRHQDAVVELSALVRDQPLREHFVALLMRALYLSGRQAEALRAFQAFREYLADETGLEPSEALVELDHRIAQGDPTLAPDAVAVPGYELAEVIGEGAFGAVYRAVQPSVGREVAVKVVRPELADDPRFVARFEAEAQLVARIEHPHVVPLYDFWRRPGGAFLVFRLLRGGSLTDREAGAALGLDEAGRLVDEVGGALAAAHALGVTHRDVKPANILYDEAGNSYLADFGIAQLADGDGDLDLRSAGSPLYASPEQLRDASASAASDQYALAVVLWEALSGRAPFAGTTATEVGRVKLAATVPPLDHDIDGAGAVGPVLARATAPHPDDRYPSMVEFVAAWHAATAGVDVLRTTGRLAASSGAGTAAATAASMGMQGANPYKGLRSFQEADAAEFCGREALVDRLLAEARESAFVTVVGPSGSGKSSLVHAGLVPALRREGALVVSMVPGVDPMLELRTALRRVATAADEATIDDRLQATDGLGTVARELVGATGRLVLVVDQFEELWTMATDPVARDRFADLLAHAADGGAPIGVVATLRADQYDLPLQHPALGPVVSDHTFAVTPMSAAEIQDAIVLPAERVGVRFEPDLVPTMVGDVVRRPGALPLLQFALTELYEQRHHATITTAAYEALGGIGGAVARRAEALYDATPPGHREDVRRLFTQLVTAEADADDLRRRATVEELAAVDPGVVEAYRVSRLIVTDHHPVTREPTVEVAHEALLREWPRLVDWIDEDRDALRVRRGISLAAAEWQVDPGDESTLLPGTRLPAAHDGAGSIALTAGERAFVPPRHALA
ncbi:MAG TPA: BTAD domain-containing putative transcriptional regulator, partial [Acidimicrobiales bacterium]|nr:BTAD domain-containing putative transcriptional regulator [Acidimicrobiales bacterium]